MPFPFPQALRLFTASQLEIAVAGEPEFDIAFWKERTDYKGYRADDNTVELFWKVLLILIYRWVVLFLQYHVISFNLSLTVDFQARHSSAPLSKRESGDVLCFP